MTAHNRAIRLSLFLRGLLHLLCESLNFHLVVNFLPNRCFWLWMTAVDSSGGGGGGGGGGEGCIICTINYCPCRSDCLRKLRVPNSRCLPNPRLIKKDSLLFLCIADHFFELRSGTTIIDWRIDIVPLPLILLK